MKVTAKITALVLGAVLMSLAASTLYFSIQMHRALSAHLQDERDNQLELVGQRFRSSVDVLQEDTRLLGQSALIESWLGDESRLANGDRQFQEVLTPLVLDTFVALARNKDEYAQVRLLSPDGMELLRVDRTPGGEIKVAEDLQDKSGRDYFARAQATRGGEVSLSRISLNVEYGKISEPEMAMLRAIAAVTDKNGKRLGYVVINKNMNPLFGEFEAALHGADLTLVGEQGHLLLHKNPANTFAWQRQGETRSLPEPLQKLVETMGSLPPEQGASLYEITDEQAINSYRVLLSNDSQLRYVDLVQHVPLNPIRKEVLASVLHHLIVVAGICLLIAGGAWLYSKRLTDRILALGHIARKIASGKAADWEEQFNDDEVADLSSALRVMHLAVKERESALRNKETQLRSVVNTVLNGVITIDAQGRIIDINNYGATIFDYSREELIGQSVERLIPPDSASEYPVFLSAFVPDDDSKVVGQQHELLGVRKDGSRFPMQLTVNELELDDQPCFVGAMDDITQRKQDEQKLAVYARQLEVRNKELQEFAYVASHDLQEPMRKIQSFGDLLMEEEGHRLTETGRDYLQRTINSAARMRMLILSLLELSRAGEAGDKWYQVDLNELLEEVVDDLQETIRHARAAVEIRPLPEVWGSKVQFYQLFHNLLSNAIKYTSREDIPRVVVFEHPKTEPGRQKHPILMSMPVVICVQDNGIGIPESYREQVFLPFERLHARDTYSGTGIGLAICKKIVESMDGAIAIDDAPGGGSQFLVGLPNSQQQ